MKTIDKSLKMLTRSLDRLHGLGLLNSRERRLASDRFEDLLELATAMAERLEKVHRETIASRIHLLCAQETHQRILLNPDLDRAVESVTSYLVKVLHFDYVALVLLDEERMELVGRWRRSSAGGGDSVPLRIDLRRNPGLFGEALFNPVVRVFHRGDIRRLGAEATALSEIASLSPDSFCLVPLVRIRDSGPCWVEKSCGESDCDAFGRVDLNCWQLEHTRCYHEIGFQNERKQEFCLRCSRRPANGVMLVGKKAGASELSEEELSSLQPLAANLASAVENAKLYLGLKKAERFRRNILDGMSSCLVVVDREQRILACNKITERLLGVSETQLVGSRAEKILSVEGIELLRETVEAGTTILRREVTAFRSSGEEIPVSLSSSPLEGEEGGIEGAIGTFLDLSPLKKMEERIKQLDRLAVLGRFAASVAHEIRNPLTGIATGIQYLGRGFGEDDPRRESLEFVLREVERLNRTVKDLLRITHMPEPNPVAADVEEVLRRSVRILASEFESKAVTLRLECRSDITRVCLDPEQIEQVVINLLRNALEASPPGSTVEVRAELVRGAPHPEKDFVRVLIRDEGEGIRPEVAEKVWEPFFSTKQEGTGLGLYVCREIVNAHRGELSFTSRPGKGTCFRIELPLDSCKESRRNGSFDSRSR